MKKLFSLTITLIFSLIVLPLGAEAQKASRPLASVRETPTVTIDLGGAAGTYNGASYSELNLGVNWNITDYFTWRNAAFKRFSSVTDQDILGLDSTLRLVSTSHFDSGYFRMFAGAGYRFADPSTKNAMIGEAGLGINIGGFGIGGGAKYLKYDKIQLDSLGRETKRDDIIYFITLAGHFGTGF